MAIYDNSGCLSRRGTPLRAFDDHASASDSAAFASERYGRATVPYRCDRCSRWHLCPRDRHTPSHDCFACSKRSYETEAGAERRAAILEEEQGVRLRIYSCPDGDGWHLTSKAW
jgi:hypothetical protein